MRIKDRLSPRTVFVAPGESECDSVEFLTQIISNESILCTLEEARSLLVPHTKYLSPESKKSIFFASDWTLNLYPFKMTVACIRT